MAIMHPKYVYQFNSLSEKKLFESLKRQLSNDYEVFYSVVWYSKDDSGERINSESDFVIVDRNKGFICIEVKGGIKYVHENDKYIVYNTDASATGTTAGTTGESTGAGATSNDEQLMQALKLLS